MRVAQQEIDRRADAGIGKIAQPAHGRLRPALAAEIGQRDQEMRLQLQRAQRRHQRGLGNAVGEGGCRDLGIDRREPRGNRRVEQRSSISGRRRAQSRRKSERSKAAARKSRTGPACESNAARRGRPRLGGGCGEARPGRARPRRGRAARAAAASTTRLAPCSLRCRCFALMARPCFRKHHRDNKAGIGRRQARGGRHGTS